MPTAFAVSRPATHGLRGTDIEKDDDNRLRGAGVMGPFNSSSSWAWILSAVFSGAWFGSSAWAGDVDVPMHGIEAGTYYVEVGVANLGNVDFLVDTGSGYTAIDTGMLSAMQETGDAVFVKRLEGLMADGSTMVVPVYRITEIRLGACLLKDVEVAVFAHGTRPILGMRALTRVAPFTFSTDPPAISLGRCDAVITAEAAEAPKLPIPEGIGEAG